MIFVGSWSNCQMPSSVYDNPYIVLSPSTEIFTLLVDVTHQLYTYDDSSETHSCNCNLN